MNWKNSNIMFKYKAKILLLIHIKQQEKKQF